MRLLNTQSQKLEEFSSAQVPPYAILSHTWGNEEVTLSEIQTPNAIVLAKAGYDKICGLARTALNDEIQYAWIDTCCIDKSSTSELSETINSMFRWYRDALVCCVYLGDVHAVPDSDGFEAQFQKSRWFTRGWTLQELIAPRHVVFYTSGWQLIGSKNELASRIHGIAGIDVDTLNYGIHPTTCMARRLSWAAQRQTTKPEDRAYSLLGLCGISMPLNYGEGGIGAFQRLQREIIKTSDDQSLFAWEVPSSIARHRGLVRDAYAILACSPDYFTNCGSVVRRDSSESKYEMTNKGLRITLPIISSERADRRTALLNCATEGDLDHYLGMQLLYGPHQGQYARDSSPIKAVRVDECWDARTETIYISAEQGVGNIRTALASRHVKLWIRHNQLTGHGFSIQEVVPRLDLRNKMIHLVPVGESATRAVEILFAHETNGTSFAAVVRFDINGGRASVWLRNMSGKTSLSDVARAQNSGGTAVAQVVLNAPSKIRQKVSARLSTAFVFERVWLLHLEVTDLPPAAKL